MTCNTAVLFVCIAAAVLGFGAADSDSNSTSDLNLFCGRNEIQKCVNSCPPEKTCDNRNIQYFCPAVVTPCKTKCVCKPGYYRNAIGNCITLAQCKQCSKPNEFFDCGDACDNVCSTLSKQNRTNCPFISLLICTEKCYCKDGYARDANDNCVPVDQCGTTSKPLLCGVNEEDQCVTDCPPEKTCRILDGPQLCNADSSSCKHKCVCMPGFYRNENGHCITKAQCMQSSTSNEVYSCGGLCDNDCSFLYKPKPLICSAMTLICTWRFYCKSGYARDENGNCIPLDQCKQPACGPNEILDNCPTYCPSDFCPRSEKEAKESGSLFCFQPEKCPSPACKCRFNYRRAKDGTCIPTRQCPAFSCSGVNEEFNPCPPLCPTDDCSQASPTGECPPIGRIGIVLPCSPKCRCQKGYWRKNGVCVPYAQCSTSAPNNGSETSPGNGGSNGSNNSLADLILN